MKAQAIIFDFDGIILDTEQAVYESWRRQYAEAGCDLPLGNWIDVLGMPSNYRDFHGELERHTGRTFDRAAMATQRSTYIESQLKGMPPRPGVTDYLEGARDRELHLAVASGSSHRWVEGHLEQLGLLDWFSVIICREDTQQHKPDAAPFLAAAVAVGASPASCIVIEDSPNGIRSAKAGGMFAVAVPTDMTREEDFVTIGADLVVNSLAELPVAELLGLGRFGDLAIE